ncbi:uncharacterized protein LOC117114736 [Anneissia japonica]|uniref:uncharacterized protein LOC117114736 n=1 Tax=Anneissia japonica TaxID=1529436 RepID=UPI001425815B|nr:uncharacterized protein LOC117114736 [Anneissia japonica]
MKSKVKKLTVDEFKSIYQYCFSEEGSNNRAKEDSTIYSFELFLQDLEENEAGGLLLKDILIFITGCEYIPPLGFVQPIRILFYSSEGNTMRRPWSSTCALTLSLPGGIDEPSYFKSLMTESLTDCHGFGNV